MASPSVPGKPVLVIDGSRFSDFPGFQREFSALLSDYEWRGNLDAFNDILRGGFGTPEGGFVLRWSSADRSREALGYAATIERLEHVLEHCHATNRPAVRERLERARRREGPTLFDEIVEIIGIHGRDGGEAEDGIELEFR